MQIPLDARSVVLHTLLGIGEVLAKLEEPSGSNEREIELHAQCTAILSNIWEVNNAYKATLGVIVKANQNPDRLAAD